MDGTTFWTAVAAVATSFAVGVALKDVLLPPRLEVAIPNQVGELTELTQRGNFIDLTRYYYLQVANTRRKWSSPAHKVQLFLLRLELLQPTQQTRGEWLGAVPIRWRNHEHVPKARTIGPTVDCDFVRVVRNAPTLELLPAFRPNNLRTLWTAPCVFIAHVQARSNEVDSEIVRFKVTWDGQWDEDPDAMRKHLQIEQV
jgi:hypothetical protein